MEVNKYLPIGSIVTLKESDVELMIIGYLKRTKEGCKDYGACVYPMGLTASILDIVMFNHEDIEKIHYLGYKSDDYIKLNGIFNKAILSGEKNVE